jgi:hypothetical protein
MAQEFVIHSLYRRLPKEKKEKLRGEIQVSKQTLYNWFEAPALRIPYVALHQFKNCFNRELRKEGEPEWTVDDIVQPIAQPSGDKS